MITQHHKVLGFVIGLLTIAFYFYELRQMFIAFIFCAFAMTPTKYLIHDWLYIWSAKRRRKMLRIIQTQEEREELHKFYWTGGLFVIWLTHFILILHLIPLFGVFLASLVAIAITVLLYNVVNTILIFRAVHQRLRATHIDQEGDDNEKSNI